MIKSYVYVLRSLKDQRWYIGQTSLLPEERLKQHNAGQVESTKNRRQLELIYYEMYLDKDDAFGREKFLKGGSGHTFLKKQLKNFLGVKSSAAPQIRLKSVGGGT